MHCTYILLLTAESSDTQRRRRSTAQRKSTMRIQSHRKRRSKSTAQPQNAEDMPIEGDSLSMKDFGMDLSIIKGYPEEQQTYGLSLLTKVLLNQVDEVIVPNRRLIN